MDLVNCLDTFVTQLLQSNPHVPLSVKPREESHNAMYCDACPCRCGIKFVW